MGLETASFVSNLVATNPVAGDTKSQGDDHLRLIKGALQSTFPNASKAFYFPDSSAKTIAYSVLATDMNKLLTGDATAGAFAFTLPTLAAGDAGWHVEIMKIDASANAVTITGTVNGAANPTLTRRYESAILLWSGTAWFMMRQRPTLDTIDFSNNSVTAAILRDSAALSVIGNPTNASTDPSDIVAASDGLVLLRSGATLAFGQVAALGITDGIITPTKMSLEGRAFQGALYHIRDEKASGTDGDALTSGSWTTRTLQTEKQDDLTVTTAANVISLAAGTYWTEINAVSHFSGTATNGGVQNIMSKLRLRNTTDGVTLCHGIGIRYQGQDDGGGNNQAMDIGLMTTISDRFVLAGTKNVELQNWITNGFSGPTSKGGKAISSGENEVYADVRIYKTG